MLAVSSIAYENEVFHCNIASLNSEKNSENALITVSVGLFLHIFNPSDTYLV